MKLLSDITSEIASAGGFGDGIDTGDTHPIDLLNSTRLTEDERLAASLSLLCRLAESVDNGTWRDATRSALARRLREYLTLGGMIAADCAAGVSAFYHSEEAFWTELQGVYQNVIATNVAANKP